MKEEHYKKLKLYNELKLYSPKELQSITNLCCDTIVNKYLMSVFKEKLHYSMQNLRLDQLFVDFYKKYRNYNFYDDILFSECNIQLDLSKDAVIAFPWNKSRLIPLFNYFDNEEAIWQEDSTNHDVVFIKPLNIFFVNCGNHSISIGKYFRKGIVHCHQMVDYSKIIKKFDFDGKYFRDIYNHKINEPYLSEFGDLFIIGKLLLENT